MIDREADARDVASAYTDPREAWEALASSDLIPASAVQSRDFSPCGHVSDDPRFCCDRCLWDRIPPRKYIHASGTSYHEYPTTIADCILFAARYDALLRAEALAAEIVLRCGPFMPARPVRNMRAFRGSSGGRGYFHQRTGEILTSWRVESREHFSPTDLGTGPLGEAARTVEGAIESPLRDKIRLARGAKKIHALHEAFRELASRRTHFRSLSCSGDEFQFDELQNPFEPLVDIIDAECGLTIWTYGDSLVDLRMAAA